MAKRRQKPDLPVRTATALSRTERAAIIRRLQKLRGRVKSFVAEITRQARGRVDELYAARGEKIKEIFEEISPIMARFEVNSESGESPAAQRRAQIPTHRDTTQAAG